MSVIKEVKDLVDGLKRKVKDLENDKTVLEDKITNLEEEIKTNGHIKNLGTEIKIDDKGK